MRFANSFEHAQSIKAMAKIVPDALPANLRTGSLIDMHLSCLMKQNNNLSLLQFDPPALVPVLNCSSFQFLGKATQVLITQSRQFMIYRSGQQEFQAYGQTDEDIMAVQPSATYTEFVVVTRSKVGLFSLKMQRYEGWAPLAKHFEGKLEYTAEGAVVDGLLYAFSK